MSVRWPVRVLLAALGLVAAQGCGDGRSGEGAPSNASPSPNELPDDEFREIARSLSEDFVTGDRLASVLGRASTEQGSTLVKMVALPRRSEQAETLAFLARIWNGDADDIPIAKQPVFRLSVASALHSLDEQQCAGCYEYARGLLSAPEAEVRSAAALEMGELGSSDDIVMLQRMIVSDDFSVAQSAAAALIGIAEADSIPILQSLMTDPAVSTEKREQLAQAIEGAERRQRIIDELRSR